MRLLGIDYGASKIGLSFSDSSLAEPLAVIHFKNKKELFAKLQKIIQERQIEKVVVGVSEGVSGQAAKDFGNSLKKALLLKLDFEDETLTTRVSQELAREAGISRQKRKGMEDAYAATLLLQNYLDRVNI